MVADVMFFSLVNILNVLWKIDLMIKIQDD